MDGGINELVYVCIHWYTYNKLSFKV